MLYREIIAVCSEIHTKHINTLCGQNVEFVNVEVAVYNYLRFPHQNLVRISFFLPYMLMPAHYILHLITQILCDVYNKS